MEETKPWYASKAIWASILQVAMGLAVSFGLLTESAAGSILADAPDLLIGVVTGLLGAYTLYSRAKATAKITVTDQNK